MNPKSLSLGQYFPGTSVIHRLDPRTKLLGVFLISVTIFLPKAWPGYLLTTGLILVVLLISQVPPRFIFQGLRPIFIFLLITAVFNAFLTPGEALYHVGRWAITREGLVLTGVAAIRLVLLVVTASLLTLTTSPILLTDGLERLLRPLTAVGVPAHELALMMTIALRFIPTLAEEADRIMRAQMARGADFHSNGFLGRIKGLVPVMVPLFVAAFRRADELAIAMEARGYRGGKGRTRMTELAMSRLDYAAMAALLLTTGAVIYLRVAGIG